MSIIAGRLGAYAGAAALVVGLSLGSVSTAHAAPKGFCKAYANAAVHQFHRNLVKQCGYAGWRWHGWRKGHYNWCRQTSKAVAMSERVARWNMLGNCW